ncbi:aminopeptidase [Bacteroidia bacterium]|nr:aminopeptidase [Bacteroidia bacterium]
MCANFIIGQDIINGKYTFTDTKVIPNTSVKNQNKSGTCWSFSTISFLESEILRNTNKEIDLADMYPVYWAYKAKAERYVRLHGETNFPGGGASGDVFWTFDNYGFLPEEAFNGLHYGESKHNHNLLQQILANTIKIAVNNKGKLDTNWRFPFNAILDAYFGQVPETFTYEGKQYTPKTFANSLNLKMSDFVSITSYTHHPFYTTFAMEVPDNWLSHISYNVPIEDFMQIAKNAIDKGYSFAWGGDVGKENGFERDPGIATLADSITTISQKERQIGFDDWTTGDDHGMHVIGSATDQNGKYYFKVKNSWSDNYKYKGYWYMSEQYFMLNTLNFIVHKNAIPANIRAKMGVK